MAYADPIVGKYSFKKKPRLLVKKPVKKAGSSLTGFGKDSPGTSSSQTQSASSGKGSGLTRPTYRPVSEADTWAAAQARASQISDPILREIAERQLRAETQARSDNQAQLAATQKAYLDAVAPTQQIYDRAIGQASTLNEAVANRLAGQGQVDAKALAERLAQINAPGAEGQSSDLDAAYKAAAAVGSAKDTSEVQALVSRGAEQQAFLEKQPGLASQAFAQELNTMLRDIGQEYGDQASEIRANIPGQVQQLYDTLFGQRSDTGRTEYEAKLGDWESAQEQTRYEAETKRQKEADAMAAKQFAADQKQRAFDNYQTKRRFLLEQRALALEYGDKATQRKFESQLAATDRAWKTEQARLDREAAMAGGADLPNLGGTSSTDKYLIDPKTGRPVGLNPNYVPPKKKDLRMNAKEARGYINDLLTSKQPIPGTSTTRQVLKTEYQDFAQKPTTDKGWKKWYSAANALVSQINAALQSAGVPPNSKEGIALRKQAMARVGIPTGKMGNPSGKGRS